MGMGREVERETLEEAKDLCHERTMHLTFLRVKADGNSLVRELQCVSDSKPTAGGVRLIRRVDVPARLNLPGEG